METKLILFDVDGTLTPARKKIESNMVELLNNLKSLNHIKIGYVGGSDFSKIKEQLDSNLEIFDYMFPENGLVAYKNKELFFEGSILDFFEEEKLQEFINFCLDYISRIEIPKKRGTFIEFRKGLINISPIGRNCNYDDRLEFYEFDKKNKIREKMISSLSEKFSNLDLHFSIGGQISFDVFPSGWDKTFCLKHIENENFQEIYFFGDKTYEGGNDYEIYNDKRIKGYSVKNPRDTINYINKLFLQNGN